MQRLASMFKSQTPSVLSKAVNIIIKSVQKNNFSEELDILHKGGNSPLAKLNPVLDEDHLLRVGGGLKQADLSNLEKNPIILPGKHNVTTLLIRTTMNGQSIKVARSPRELYELQGFA